MRKLQIYLILLLIVLSSCQLFEPKPESEKFYCQINGKKFRPGKDNSLIWGFSYLTLRAEFSKTHGMLSIFARNSPKSISLILILKPNEELRVGEFNLSNNIRSSKGYFAYNTNESPVDDLISISGKISITKIEDSNIFGTFEFKSHSAKQNKDYTITKGQFNNLNFLSY